MKIYSVLFLTMIYFSVALHLKKDEIIKKQEEYQGIEAPKESPAHTPQSPLGFIGGPPPSQPKNDDSKSILPKAPMTESDIFQKNINDFLLDMFNTPVFKSEI